jgi:hypothetical protein
VARCTPGAGVSKPDDLPELLKLADAPTRQCVSASHRLG